MHNTRSIGYIIFQRCYEVPLDMSRMHLEFPDSDGEWFVPAVVFLRQDPDEDADGDEEEEDEEEDEEKENDDDDDEDGGYSE